MLAARVGTAGDEDLDVRLESRESALELWNEIQAEPLRLGNSELAVLGAGAREYPTTERRPFQWRRRAARRRPLQCTESLRRNAEHDDVLHCRRAQRSSAIFVGERGQRTQGIRGDATRRDCETCIERPAALLGMDPDVIAERAIGRHFRNGGTERVAQSSVELGEKSIRRPAMREK